MKVAIYNVRSSSCVVVGNQKKVIHLYRTQNALFVAFWAFFITPRKPQENPKGVFSVFRWGSVGFLKFKNLTKINLQKNDSFLSFLMASVKKLTDFINPKKTPNKPQKK